MDDQAYWAKVGAEDRAHEQIARGGKAWLWGFACGVLAAYPLWHFFWWLAGFYRWLAH